MTDLHCYSSSSDDEYFEDASPISTNEKAPTIREKIEKISNQQQNLSIFDDTSNDCTKDKFSDCQDTHDDEDDNDTIDDNEIIIDNDKLQRDYEATLTTEQLLANKERADTLKLDGNQKFKEELYADAIEIYTEAIKLCPLSYTDERSILYGNRAATNIQLDAKLAAIDDCTKALELNKNYIKVLIR